MQSDEVAEGRRVGGSEEGLTSVLIWERLAFAVGLGVTATKTAGNRKSGRQNK